MSSAGGGFTIEVQALRRGSVPVEIARHFRKQFFAQKYCHFSISGFRNAKHFSGTSDEDNGNRSSITPVETTRSFWQYQRRGSAPVDLPPTGTSTRFEFTRHTSLNGKVG